MSPWWAETALAMPVMEVRRARRGAITMPATRKLMMT
jgi:hypothetical protein